MRDGKGKGNTSGNNLQSQALWCQLAIELIVRRRAQGRWNSTVWGDEQHTLTSGGLSMSSSRGRTMTSYTQPRAPSRGQYNDIRSKYCISGISKQARKSKHYRSGSKLCFRNAFYQKLLKIHVETMPRSTDWSIFTGYQGTHAKHGVRHW